MRRASGSEKTDGKKRGRRVWLPALLVVSAVLFLMPLVGCGSAGTPSTAQAGAAGSAEASGAGEAGTDQTGVESSLYIRAETDGRKSTEIFAMDTIMSLSIAGKDAEEMLHLCEGEIRRIEKLLTAEDRESEIGQINAASEAAGAAKTTDKAGQPASGTPQPVSDAPQSDSDAPQGNGKDAGIALPVSEETAALLEEALLVSRATDGAFDISLYPVTELWGFSTGEYRVPEAEELKETLARCGYEKISVSRAQDGSGSTLGFAVPRMAIGLGAIGKGYTSQRLADLLSAHGVTSALLNLGGNVQAVGNRPDGKPWRIAIRHPEEGSDYLGILSVSDEAVVTSGGYERFFEKDGVTYHHILDPDTGYPAESGILSATVICTDGTCADALSTAVFVMGREKAEALWQSFRGTEDAFDMILFLRDGTLAVTEGVAERLETSLTMEVIR